MALVPYDMKIELVNIPTQETKEKLQELRSKVIFNHKEYEEIRKNGASKECVIKMYETNLGTYATKERALEVLDEIEESVLSQTKTFINEEELVIDSVNMEVIYQMPKE